MVKEFDCGHFVQEEKTKETIQEIEILCSFTIKILSFTQS